MWKLGRRPHDKVVAVRRRSYLIAVGAASLTAIVAGLLGVIWPKDFFSEFAPSAHGGDQLQSMWQVLATFVAVAFAGIAILFQVFPQNPSLALDRRDVLVRRAYVIETAVVGSVSTIVVGLIAVWLPSDASAIAAFALLFVPAVLLVLFSYLRIVGAFVDPRPLTDLAEEIAATRLFELARRSLWSAEVSAALYELDVKGKIVWARFGLRTESREARRTVTLLAADQDMRVIRIDVESLTKLATEVQRSTNQPGPEIDEADFQPRLVVRAVQGETVRAGVAMLSVEIGSRNSGSAIGKWIKLARKCIELEPAELGDAAVETLRVLCDGIERSLREGRLVDAAAGLKTYRRLFAVLVRAVDADADDLHSLDGVNGAQPMSVGLYGIGAAALASGPRHLDVVLNALQGMALDASRWRHLGAWRFVLREYEFLWDDAVVQGIDEQPLRYLTVQLTSLHDLAVPSIPDAVAQQAFRVEIVLTLTQMMRKSQDSDPNTSTIISLQDTLDQIGGPRSSGNSAALVAGSALILLGWELLQRAAGRFNPVALEIAMTRAQNIEADLIERGLEFALSQVEHEGQISWWESELHRSGEAHWVQFPTQIRIAAAYAGLTADQFGHPWAWTIDDATQVRMMRDALLASDDDERFAQFAATLEEMIVSYDLRQMSILADTPLNSDSVATFGAAVVTMEAAPPALVAALSVPKHHAASNTDWEDFTLRSLFPRAFFIPSPYVIAEPAEIAETCMDQLRARQVEIALDGLRVSPIEGEIPTAAVEEAIEAAIANIDSLLIVVLNSRYIRDVVRNTVLAGSSSALVEYVSTDDDNAEVLLVDLDVVGHLQLDRPSDPSLEIVPDSQIGWRVSEPTNPQPGSPAALVTVGTRMRWTPNPDQVVSRLRVTDAPW